MPYLKGAPFPAGNAFRAPSYFDFDFRLLGLGPISAASLLSTTAAFGHNVRGLTFTRSTVSTVQTSDTTVNSTPGVNDACIGCRDTSQAHRGLVLETRQQNTIQGAGRDFSSWAKNQNAFFGGTTVPTVTPGATGPDGTNNASAMACTAWGYINQALGQTGKRTFSSWQNGNSMMLMENAAGSGGNQPGTVLTIFGSSSWQRRSVTEGATHTIQYSIIDGRDETGFGGPLPGSCISTVDFAQLQYGTFMTEAIIAGTVTGAGVAREDDRLSYAVGSELISTDSRLRVRFTFIPKFASTEQVMYAVTSTSSPTVAAYWWLLSWSTLDTNYIRINDSDHKLAVKFGGAEVVSTNAIAWSKFDVVVLEVEAGNGLPSVARYTLNGGAWTDLVLGAVIEVPAPGANPVAIMRDIAVSSRSAPLNDDRGQPPCWLQRLTFYGKTPVPSEIVLTEDGDTRITEAGDLRITEPS